MYNIWKKSQSHRHQLVRISLDGFANQLISFFCTTSQQQLNGKTTQMTKSVNRNEDDSHAEIAVRAVDKTVQLLLDFLYKVVSCFTHKKYKNRGYVKSFLAITMLQWCCWSSARQSIIFYILSHWFSIKSHRCWLRLSWHKLKDAAMRWTVFGVKWDKL